MSLDTNLQSAFNAIGLQVKNKVSKSDIGIANGIASLGADGKVPASQLPSFVDGVLEFVNLAGFPTIGETGKIYVALDTNKTYRWSGSTYVYITSGAVDSVAGKTGVVTLTKADVGLNNVDNTSDANKPISTATQIALDNKSNVDHTHIISDITNLQSSLDNKSNVGHIHAITDINGLETSLNDKANQTDLINLTNSVGPTNTDYVAIFNNALI